MAVEIKKLSGELAPEECYEILEVNGDATKDEIKKAYHRLALKYHPDRNIGSDEAVASFMEVNKAYGALEDVAFGYYQILGISKSADIDDVNRAYVRVVDELNSNANMDEDKRQESLQEVAKALQYFTERVQESSVFQEDISGEDNW